MMRIFRHSEVLSNGIHAEGVPEQAVAETLFGFGCYAGEVLVRRGAGRWESPGGEERQHMDAPFVVRFPNGVVANPVHRCFRRYRDGATEGVGYFGQVMLARQGGTGRPSRTAESEPVSRLLRQPRQAGRWGAPNVDGRPVR